MAGLLLSSTSIGTAVAAEKVVRMAEGRRFHAFEGAWHSGRTAKPLRYTATWKHFQLLDGLKADASISPIAASAADLCSGRRRAASLHSPRAARSEDRGDPRAEGQPDQDGRPGDGGCAFRRNFGILPMSDLVIAEQQKIADTLKDVGLIPRAIKVSAAVLGRLLVDLLTLESPPTSETQDAPEALRKLSPTAKESFSTQSAQPRPAAWVSQCPAPICTSLLTNWRRPSQSAGRHRFDTECMDS